MSLKKSFLGDIDVVDNTYDWLNRLMQDRPAEDVSMLLSAIELIEDLAVENYIIDGLSLVEHSKILLILGVKFNTDIFVLIVLLLYPAYINNLIDFNDYPDQFDANIMGLLTGSLLLNDLEKLWDKSGNIRSSQVDNMRKLLMVMVDDIRVVVVKLVYQLSLMYYVDSILLDKNLIATLSQKLYAPLANRLGMGEMKWQLEDLSFRVLLPQDYSLISKAIKEKRNDRQAKVKIILEKMQSLCANLGKFSFSGRVKHFYGIHSKINKKQVLVDDIYDTLAIRIITDSIDNCYAVLSKINSTYKIIEQEFDDYIAAPKPNGYQSIHTAIQFDEIHVVEVQIRTKKMHDLAESGVASHWLYKEGGIKGPNVEDKVAWLQQLVDWQSGLNLGGSQISGFKDRVFVFTPKGKVIDLPKGSTPLDFAYHIHTQVGHGCRGAKVNGKIVPLTAVLSNADRVQVITTKLGSPSRDWLRNDVVFLFSSSAKNKVLNWFKRQDHNELFAKGQILLSQAIKQKLTNTELLNLAKAMNCNDVNDLLLGLARHDFTVSLVARKWLILKNVEANDCVSNIIVPRPKKVKHQLTDVPIIVEGLTGMLVCLAKCCNPVLGDSIIGRVSKSKGVVVHKQDCSQVVKILDFSDRVLEVSWESDIVNKAFTVHLAVLVNSLTESAEVQQWLHNKKIAWNDWRCINRKNNILINMVLLVDNKEVLNACIVGLLSIKGVISVNRGL